MRIKNIHDFRQATSEQADLLSAVAGKQPTAEQSARLQVIESAIAEFVETKVRRPEPEANVGGTATGNIGGSVGHRTLTTSIGRTMTGRINVLPPTAEQMDHDLGVAIQSLVLGTLDNQSPASIAMEHFNNDRVSAAMTAGNHAGGGSWISGEFSDRFIELLRPVSVMRNIADMLPLDDGTLTIPKITSGPSGRYLGENESALAEDVATGDVKLIAKELVVVVPASEKLIRSPSAKASERIRNVVLGAAAETEDAYFLRGAVGGAGPAGLRNLVDPSHVIAANLTINLANVCHDLGRLETLLMQANMKMLRPAWIMSPRSLVYLSDLRDGNGNLAFPELTSGSKPMLRRKPVYVTTQVPNNLYTNTTGSEVMLVEGVHCLIGDAPRIGLQSSNVAAYKNSSGTIVSAFSDRRVVTRLVEENDFAIEHDQCAAVLTDVQWGV